MGGTQYNRNNVGNEYSLMPTLSIPHGFVGEWISCPLQPKWRTVSTRVLISDNSQFFSSATNMSNFYASNYYTPQQTWVSVSAASVNLLASQTMNSTYPSNYYQTPYPIGFRLLATNAATTENSYLPVAGSGGSAYVVYGPDSTGTNNFLWPTNVNYRYFDTSSVDAGSGTPPTFYDLPGVEFDSRGFPTFTSTNLTFVFTEKRNTNNYYQVVIDSTIGIPRLVTPTGQ